MPESSSVVRPQPPGTPASARLQAAGLQTAVRHFEAAAGSVPLPLLKHPILIADYGAGNGYNALLPICAAITVLRGRTRPEHSVLIIHTDTADNDFSELFRVVSGDPDSYLRKDSSTFTSAVGRSYYTQIIPSNSVHLGWSAWSILWLGQQPMPVTDHVVVAHSSDTRVRDAYARQAAHDWHEFAAFRGREMRPGGKLIVLTMGLTDDGDFGHRPLLTALVDTLSELRTDGIITAEELQRMSLPIVGRSVADFTAPFAPFGRMEGLSIEHLEVTDAGDRFFNQYQKDHDATAFGAQWAAFCRFTVFRTLAGALDRPDTHAEFFDRLESGIAERLAAAPEQAQIPLATVVLTKQSKS